MEGRFLTREARRIAARRSPAAGDSFSGEAAQFQHDRPARRCCFPPRRIDHIDVTIQPALTRGEWVVCDRTFADLDPGLSGGRRSQLDPAFIARLERVAVGSTRPDLTLILDLPAEQGLARAAKRRRASAAPDRFEGEGVAFHETLRHAFLEIAREEPERCAVIEASASEEEVADAIWDVVSRRLAEFLAPETKSS